MLRRRALRPFIDRYSTLVDIALALVLFGLALLTLRVMESTGEDAWSAQAVGAIALTTLPLALRHRYPVAVLGVMTAALIGYEIYDAVRVEWSNNATLIAFYTVGVHCRRYRDLVRTGVVVAIFGLIIYEITFTEPVGYSGDLALLRLLTLLANAFIFVGVWWLSDSVRVRRERELQLAERTEQLVQEREENARRAVLEERVRIARELHDVVAHHVSVMGIQAGAARRVLARQPDKAEEVLSTIEASSRQAVQELHRLLGFLRQGQEAEGTAPQPSLSQLDVLVTQMREAGLPVEVRIEGEAQPLAPSVDLSAYRIVQEALTNVLKHAGRATAEVTVRYSPQAVDIEVVDDGRGSDSNGQLGTGNGLIGMRERVMLLGGTLDIGRHRGVGFSVRAHLPLGTAA